MAFEWHEPIVIIPTFTAWTAALAGLLRWSLQRNIKDVEISITEAADKASMAIAEAGELREAFQRSIKEMDKELVGRCAGHNGRLATAESAIARVGGEIRNLPQHRHIHELSARMEQINGSVEKVAGRLDGLARAVDLMNEFLISQGGKK
jgi:predicted nuclease with TOPRIM domain